VSTIQITMTRSDQNEADANRWIEGKLRRFTRTVRRRKRRLAVAFVAIPGLALASLLQLCRDDAPITPMASYAAPTPRAENMSSESLDRYSGFIFAVELLSVDETQVRLMGFRFRPTRARHRAIDVHGNSTSIDCTYQRDRYAAMVRPLDSLLSFTATEGANGELLLTSCPEDALLRGNLDVGN